MLGRWWRGIGVRASLRRRRLCDSGAFAGQCFRVVGVGALVGWWRCHGVGADALVSEGRDLTINLRGVRRGEGDAQHDKQHDEEPGNIRLGQKLSKGPRNLYVLWREFDVGLDGGKAARDFTSSERGANRYAYSRRKVFWDAVAGLLQMGYTIYLAVDRVCETYKKRLSVMMIMDAIIVEEQVGIYVLTNKDIQE
jgi:hypothetical protein